MRYHCVCRAWFVALTLISEFTGLPVMLGAQVTPAAGGYLFRHRLRAGQTGKFSVTVTSSSRAMAAPVVTNIPITVRVVSMAANTAKVSVMVEPMTRFGRTQGKPSTTEIEVDFGGPKGKNSMMTYMEYGDLYMPFLPKPIRVGQSFPIDRAGEWPVLGRVDVSARYTFSGFTTLAGKKAARFAMTATKRARVDSTITGTILISTDDGSTLNVDQTATVKMPSGDIVTQQLTARRQ